MEGREKEREKRKIEMKEGMQTMKEDHQIKLQLKKWHLQ